VRWPHGRWAAGIVISGPVPWLPGSPIRLLSGESTLSVQQFKRIVDSGVLERLHHGLYRLARMPEDVHLDGRVERLDQPAPTDCSRIARPPAYTG